MSLDKIIIKGAKENNLKNIDLTLPRDKFIVFTGLSGSGKTSLAFDTIYAEGQRRYIESLSSYARQFLGQMEKPDVEFIEGLSPAISIDQKSTNHNPRSTVGTVTEIYDYLRLLFARIGTAYCPHCKKEIKRQTIDQMVDQVLLLPEKTRIQILAPVIRNRKGEHVKLLEDARKNAYVRVRIDGVIHDLSEEIQIDKNKKHHIEIVIDRLIIKEGIEKRLSDSMENALALSNGLVIVHIQDQEDILFSQHYACPDCNFSLPEIEPRLFSFNNPQGACPECTGLGYILKFDEDMIVPNPKLSLSEGAVAVLGWNAIPDKNSMSGSIFRELAKTHSFDLRTPFEELSEDVKHLIFYGDTKAITVQFEGSRGKREFSYVFEGIIPNLIRRYRESSDAIKSEYESYMTNIECSECHGERLKKEVLSIRIQDKNIADITKMPVVLLHDFFSALKLSDREFMIAEAILKEIKARIGFLMNVGLDYLSLSRPAQTLSGGESQRIRLATQIGSGLVGVIYILDEPSIGLHQKDNDMLLETLKNLKNLGNTLIVVEHDEDTMFACDYIVDIGPGAGVHGGEVVACGTVDEIMANPKSITGAYLSGRKEISVPKARRKINKKEMLTVQEASQNNLKKLNVKIPLGVFTCVTGVSGSGKSSLVNEIIYKRLAKDLNRAKVKPGAHKNIKGIEKLDKVINIDQSPIGRTPRSNPATYTGVFDLIRDLYAELPDAKLRGYKKGRFSFNVRGGRCEACAGDGILKIAMHFLPDIYVPCEVCEGKRYNRETLEVKYKNKTISDILQMNVEEALLFFENIPKIKNKLQTLYDVGLSYIQLGQSSTTLSGGEAQRVKLASELSKKSTGKTMYILDEPTTGLHTADVQKLIDIIRRLVKGGNTALVIEHNLDVIKTADYIIDLGPQGGDRGGEVVAQGTPEQVAKNNHSYTGKYLAKMLWKE